jgi:hypothetical protein
MSSAKAEEGNAVDATAVALLRRGVAVTAAVRYVAKWGLTQGPTARRLRKPVTDGHQAQTTRSSAVRHRLLLGFRTMNT